MFNQTKFRGPVFDLEFFNNTICESLPLIVREFEVNMFETKLYF